MAGSDQHVNGGGNIMVWDVFLLLVLVILHVFMGPWIGIIRGPIQWYESDKNDTIF